MKVNTIQRESKPEYLMIHVTETEALEIVESLARQIHSKNSNFNRVEHKTDDQRSYVSISVIPDRSPLDGR